MFRTLSLIVKQCIAAVSIAFLLLLTTGLGEELNVDMQSSAIWVASLLALLILIYPKLSRLAFAERMEAEMKKLNIKG